MFPVSNLDLLFNDISIGYLLGCLVLRRSAVAKRYLVVRIGSGNLLYCSISSRNHQETGVGKPGYILHEFVVFTK